jgi:hypothetical protein
MTPMPNRRRYPRHPVSFSAKTTFKDGISRERVEDVAAGGIGVIARRSICPGQPVNLQFPAIAFGRQLSVMGTVGRNIND